MQSSSMRFVRQLLLSHASAKNSGEGAPNDLTLQLRSSFSRSELKRSAVQNTQMQEIFKQSLLLRTSKNIDITMGSIIFIKQD